MTEMHVTPPDPDPDRTPPQPTDASADAGGFLARWIAQGRRDDVLDWLNADDRRLHVFLPNPDAGPSGSPDDPELWLPIHHAAAAGDTELLDACLARGAQPDARTRYANPFHARQTALHLAAAAGHAAAIDRLAHAGAEVNVVDAAGHTPLHLAARHHHPNAVAALARAGADLEQPDPQARTALHLALTPHADPPTGSTATTTAQARRATVLALLTAGADPNAPCPRDPRRYTPLLRAQHLDAPDQTPDQAHDHTPDQTPGHTPDQVADLTALLHDHGADPNLQPPAPDAGSTQN